MTEGMSSELEAALARMTAALPSRWGSAPHTLWRTCRDGWVIGYTTGRIQGGPHDGRFATLVYRPVGKGSRGGRATAQEWELAKLQPAATRKLARARGVRLFRQHDG